MQLRKLWLAAAAGSIVMVLSAQVATASCNQYGKVVRLYTNVSGSNDFSYAYILRRTTSIATYGYYYRIDAEDANALSALVAALASGQTVRISGSASSCPTSGTWRYGGLLNSINVYAQY